MLETRLVSSLEKCFVDQAPDLFPVLSGISILRNERLSFQLLLRWDMPPRYPVLLTPTVEGSLSPFVTLRVVESVPVSLPTYHNCRNDDYLRTDPGLFPDLLCPLPYGGRIPVGGKRLCAVWVELDPPEEGFPAGEQDVVIRLSDGETELAAERLSVTVVSAQLPPQSLIYTQWFHCDCLAQYYGCEVWSEKHWEIIEHFARMAVRHGINLLLTPIHTPPLDTEVGGERLTTQLVDVSRNGGEYAFSFEKLDRWIDMCDRVGIRYLEMAHFFSQWGAAHAPKIMATVDGEYRRLFGWETDATGDDYVTFLHAYIPALLDHLRARGDDKRCYFHISDEPHQDHLETYLTDQRTVRDLLEGYPIMDAMSNVEFVQSGATKMPVVATNRVEAFLGAGIPVEWVYYCCGQNMKVSNHFISMPLWRTRSIGLQLFRFDIRGFLHWGYNFYNTFNSIDQVNPFLDTCGNEWVPGGDTFTVYPAPDGTPLESIRAISFYEALQDQRALDLAASLCGKERVVQEVESVFGEIRFDRCAKSAAPLLEVREKINTLIASHANA